MTPSSAAGSEELAGEGPEVLVPRLEEEARRKVLSASSVAELESLEAEVLGRSSTLAEMQRLIASRPAPERPVWGRALQGARGALESAFQERRSELAALERSSRAERERADLTEVLPGVVPGRLHLVTRTRDALEDTFLGMGYVVVEGPEVETDWHNFEALNMPPWHPARDALDSFFLRTEGTERTVLRTHTSPVQIRIMQRQPPPIYAVMPGRAYRRDAADASHLPAFHQIECLVVDEGVTFSDLAGTIDTFTRAFFGASISTRLRPAFFPFTEPSAELDITCTVCGGRGCRTCSGSGWLELGGCGMVDPAVFDNVGIDPERWSGFAFGFGIDRCALMRWAIPDLRLLTDNDVRFLREA